MVTNIVIVNKLPEDLRFPSVSRILKCINSVTFALVIYVSRSLGLLALLSKAGIIHFLIYILCGSAHSVLNCLKLSNVLIWQSSLNLFYYLCSSIAKCKGSN